MATITELRSAGTEIELSDRGISEPLESVEPFVRHLGRFNDQVYNLHPDSHLYRFLQALAGETGAGATRKDLVFPRLQQMLGGAHFNALDVLFAGPLALPRLAPEFYTSSAASALTRDEWLLIWAADAAYRARALCWMRALQRGGSKEGLALAGQAATGYEFEVIEQWRYLDNQASDDVDAGMTNYGKTTSRREFVMIPRAPSLTEFERHQVLRLADRLRPVDSVVTVTTGADPRVLVQTLDAVATSRNFVVKRLVTGRTDVAWPAVDASKGLWIEPGVENEAPTFAWVDRQGGATFLTVESVSASTTKFGEFSNDQKQLFPYLATVDDPFQEHSADFAFTSAFAPVGLDAPWTRPDVVLFNNYYPAQYLDLVGIQQEAPQSGDLFWASEENPPVDDDNLWPYPDGDGPISAYGNDFGAVARVADVTLFGRNSIEYQRLSIGSGAVNLYPTVPTNWVPVKALSVYTFSAYSKPAVAGTERAFHVEIRWYNGSNVLISTTTGPNSTELPTDFVRAAATGTAPIGAEWAQPALVVNGGAATFEVHLANGWLFEQASSAGTHPSAGSEVLEFELGSARPVNYLDFEVSKKPLDVTILYRDDVTLAWNEVEPDPDSSSPPGIFYRPDPNPWLHWTAHFDTITASAFRVVFARRDDVFPPDAPTDSNPLGPPVRTAVSRFSVEVRNFRAIHLVTTESDFVADAGTDVLGNAWRSEIDFCDEANVLADDETLWLSKPNPERTAVEALYFELGGQSVQNTQADLDGDLQSTMDGVDQYDIEHSLGPKHLVSEIFVDPITYGCSMRVYYSDDNDPDWDNKMWTPVPQAYVLHRGWHALPLPFAARYVKLEFTNLQPIPYNTIDYPEPPPTTFLRHPSWVQSLFQQTKGVLIDASTFEPDTETVTFDPYDFFKIALDEHDTALPVVARNMDEITAPSEAETEPDVLQQLATQTTTTQTTDQQAVEDKIHFRPPTNWQQDLSVELDLSRALSRYVFADGDDSQFAIEDEEEELDAPDVSSKEDLTKERQEKLTPDMWFPRKCRHGYQVVEGRLPKKLAYHVGVRHVSFWRRDYTVGHDDQAWVETLDDTQNVLTNSFTQNGVGVYEASAASQTIVTRSIVTRARIGGMTLFPVCSGPDDLTSGDPVALWGTATAMTEVNLLANEGFEVNTTGWATSGGFVAAGSTLTRVTAQHHSGAAAGQVVTTAVNNEGIVQGGVAVTAGKPYTFSVYLKGNAGGESLAIFIGDGVVGSANAALTLTTGWVRYSVTFTPSASGTTSVSIRTQSASVYTFFVDDAQAEQASSPSDYYEHPPATRAGVSWWGGWIQRDAMAATFPVGTLARVRLRPVSNTNGTWHLLVFKDDDTLAFSTQIATPAQNRWNELDVLLPALSSGNYRMSVEQWGGVSDVQPTAPFEASLQLLRPTVTWEASADDGVTYQSFYNSLGDAETGINFRNRGHNARIRATSIRAGAWVAGWEARPRYRLPGQRHDALINILGGLDTGFEVGVSQWDTVSSWFLNAGGTLTQDATQFHSGSKSAKVVTTAGAAFQGARYATVPVVAGKTYTFEVWVKGNAGGEPLQLGFGSSTTGSSTLFITPTTSWTKYAITLAATGTSLAQLGVMTRTATACTFFFDDFKVYQY